MEKLQISEDQLAAFCRAHGIRRLSLFGSVLKDTDHASSDIDLLVEFESGRTPGFLGLGEMEEELSRLMHGRAVELHTAADLSRHFRDSVLADAELQYGA